MQKVGLAAEGGYSGTPTTHLQRSGEKGSPLYQPTDIVFPSPKKFNDTLCFQCLFTLFAFIVGRFRSKAMGFVCKRSPTSSKSSQASLQRLRDLSRSESLAQSNNHAASIPQIKTSAFLDRCGYNLVFFFAVRWALFSSQQELICFFKVIIINQFHPSPQNEIPQWHDMALSS